MKVWSIRLVILLMGLLGIFWVASQALVPGLIKKAATQYGAQLGYEIVYKNLSLSPLLLRIEVDEFHLSRRGSNELLGFKKLTVALKWTKLMMGELGFDEIILDEPKLLIERVSGKPNGIKPASLWNWEEFIQAVEKNVPQKSLDRKVSQSRFP